MAIPGLHPADQSDPERIMHAKIRSLERDLAVLKGGLWRAAGGRAAGLPNNAQDGQNVVFLADADDGVLWSFKYRKASSSSYKWEFVGGSALRDLQGTGADHNQTTAVWTDISGMSITLPLEGDYEAFFGARIWTSTAGGSHGGQVRLARGGNMVGHAILESYVNSGASAITSRGAATVKLTQVPAGSVITMQAYSLGAANIAVSDREMWIRPIRVT